MTWVDGCCRIEEYLAARFQSSCTVSVAFVLAEHDLTIGKPALVAQALGS